MEYNTKLTKIILAEYGRHVHTMIWQALNMKDRKKKNSFAHRIIKIMEDQNPNIRDIPNFHHKL